MRTEEVTILDVSENVLNATCRSRTYYRREWIESRKIWDGDVQRPCSCLRATAVPQAVRTESRKGWNRGGHGGLRQWPRFDGKCYECALGEYSHIGQIVVNVVQEPTPKSREHSFVHRLLARRYAPASGASVCHECEAGRSALDVVLHARVDLRVCVRIMTISKLRKSMDLFDERGVRIVSDLRPIDVRNNISARACCFNDVTSHHCSLRKVETRSSSPKIQQDQTVRCSIWTVSLPFDRLP